ncbi:MAG: hypothetical protein AB8E15_09405 [Bdellovibrionales bacterium]
MKVLLLAFSCVSLLSCTGLKRSESAPTQTKYVPMQARGAMGLRKRVVVLPFIDMVPGRSMKVADRSRSAFIRNILKTNQFVAIKPSDLPQDVERFRMTDKYNLEALSKMASGSDVKAVIEGSILDLRAKKLGDQVGVFRKIRAQVTASIKIRVFSTENQKLIYEDIREATVETNTRVMGKHNPSSRGLDEDPNLIRAAIDKAMRGSVGGIAKSIDKLNWKGRIAMIQGDRIFVNAGRLSGLQVGDILRVSSEGQQIYDPETGVFIGKAPGRSKGTIELVKYFGNDGAVAIIHSGGGFTQNDIVDIY